MHVVLNSKLQWYSKTKVTLNLGFSFRNGITFPMQWFYVRSMRRRIIACNRQQRWPYNILIEKLQGLEEKPNFSLTTFATDFSTTFIKTAKT